MTTLGSTMQRFFAAAAAAAALTMTLGQLPALARDSYVKDGAGLLNSATITAIDSQVGEFQQKTGKEVVVVTVPSLDGQTLDDAAAKTFSDEAINGVLIFIAKDDRKDLVLGDRASRAFFPPGTFKHISDAMATSFKQGDFDAGVTTGVNLVLDQYRSHEGNMAAPQGEAQPVATTPITTRKTGSHMSFFWLLIILLAGFLIIRAIFRAMSAPRMMPPGPGGPPMAGPGYGPGYGGGGYGPGYGGGGGGGSFFSGLLGGLGGAFIGNELFGGRGGGTPLGGPADAAQPGFGGVDAQNNNAGWQSDAGQADVGNAGGGDWGSGGGFDAGGGGDSGGFDGGGGGDGGSW